MRAVPCSRKRLPLPRFPSQGPRPVIGSTLSFSDARRSCPQPLTSAVHGCVFNKSIHLSTNLPFLQFFLPCMAYATVTFAPLQPLASPPTVMAVKPHDVSTVCYVCVCVCILPFMAYAQVTFAPLQPLIAATSSTAAASVAAVSTLSDAQPLPLAPHYSTQQPLASRAVALSDAQPLASLAPLQLFASWQSLAPLQPLASLPTVASLQPIAPLQSL